jgi:hypothetical protein
VNFFDPFFINVVLLILIVILFIVLSWVWPPDSPWAPWWRISAQSARIAARLANITKKDTVYELGSGDGSFVRTCAKEFGARAVGIEIDTTRHLLAKFLVWRQKVPNITLIKDNFNNQDLSKASVVFIYLVPRAIKRIMPKLQKELRPGTKIISYVYPVDLPLFAKNAKERIYVYKMEKRKK